MKYRLLIQFTVAELEAEINQFLRANWELRGDTVVVPHCNGFAYFQAITSK